MAKIEFKGCLPLPKSENRLKQGDFVYCKGNDGTKDFWGIVNQRHGIISLDGASNEYIKYGKNLYLGETYSYWTIIKRVPCEKMKVTLEELE